MLKHKTTTSRRTGVNRRQFISRAGASVLSVIAAPAVITQSRAAGQNLVITLWGGQQGEAFTEAFLKPFTAETGINVVDAGAPEMARVKAMVQTRNVEWDVVLPDVTGLTSGEREGLWEPVDYSIVDMSEVVPGLKREHGLPYEMIAGGICWSEERNGKREQHPESWVEFMDTKRFPGRRGLRPRASEMLELALLGDGVPPKQLYPLDVERAFKALDRLKPSVSNWIKATPQTITLVQQNECDFTYAYNGRVFAARNSGIPVQMTRSGNLVFVDYMAVVKGSKMKDAAMRLFAFTLRKDRQAAYANLVPYGPINVNAPALCNENVRPYFANLTDPANVLISTDYWASRADELNARFKEWLAV